MSLYNKSSNYQGLWPVQLTHYCMSKTRWTFLTSMYRRRKSEKEIGCFNFLKMPFCYWNELQRHQTFVAAQLSEGRQTKLFDAIWGSPVLRITIQLVDTLVIIHGTHAYYPRETEQWFSVVGSEQLEVLTSAKIITQQQWNSEGLEGCRHLRLPWV